MFEIRNLRTIGDDFLLSLLAVGGATLMAYLVVSGLNILYVGVLMIAGVFGFMVIQYPQWGLYLLVFVIYTHLSHIGKTYYNLPSIIQLFVPFLLGVVWVRWLLYEERPQKWGKAAWLLGAWAMLVFSSMLYAADYAKAQNSFIDLIKDSIIALVIIQLMHRTTIFRNMIWALLLAGIFIGTINSYQFLTGTFSNPYAGFAQTKIEENVDNSDDVRISGPFGSNNFFAQIMLVLIPLALDRLWHERKVWLKLWAGWALIAVTLSVVFTFSRGGFLAVMVMIGTILVVNPPKLHYIGLTMILGIGLLQFLPESYINRLTTLNEIVSQGSADELQLSDQSFRGRASEMLAAGYMFLDYPLLGVGSGNYNTHYQDYSEELGLDNRREERSAHSLYLEMAAEKGIVGLVLFGVILWVMFKSIYRATQLFKKAQTHDYQNMTFAFAVGLVGYFVAAFFLHDAFPRFFWLFFGIALALPHIAEQEYLSHLKINRNTTLS